MNNEFSVTVIVSPEAEDFMPQDLYYLAYHIVYIIAKNIR